MVTARIISGIAIIGWVGCATATEVQPDAPGTGPGSNHPDAAMGGGGHDAPATQQPDAPVVSGTCATPFTGVLATWTFTGATGSQAATTSASSATGMAAGSVTRAATLTSAAGQNSINSSAWATTSSRDTTKYYSFTITPPHGCQLDLTTLAIDAKSSASGPSSAVASTSDDTFGATATVSTTAASTPSLSVTGATAAVEVRVYGFAATGASGTMRLQNTLSISGSLH